MNEEEIPVNLSFVFLFFLFFWGWPFTYNSSPSGDSARIPSCIKLHCIVVKVDNIVDSSYGVLDGTWVGIQIYRAQNESPSKGNDNE